MQGDSMTISRLQLTTRFIGTIAVIAAITATGWSRASEAAPLADTATMPAVKKSSPHAGASLNVTVSLSPAVAKQAAPDDVVYVFARAVNGPRMPLAIVRKQVKDLPATIVLEDSQGMGQGMMTLSSAPEVIVVARVSKSGMANAQNGDLEGMSAPVKKGTKAIAISIAKVVTGQKDMMSPHGKPPM
jgi:cytochrome c-type biogenesis protein CcmH